jgi:hypothetical protein
MILCMPEDDATRFLCRGNPSNMLIAGLFDFPSIFGQIAEPVNAFSLRMMKPNG